MEGARLGNDEARACAGVEVGAFAQAPVEQGQQVVVASELEVDLLQGVQCGAVVGGDVEHGMPGFGRALQDLQAVLIDVGDAA